MCFEMSLEDQMSDVWTHHTIKHYESREKQKTLPTENCGTSNVLQKISHRVDKKKKKNITPLKLLQHAGSR